MKNTSVRREYLLAGFARRIAKVQDVKKTKTSTLVWLQSNELEIFIKSNKAGLDLKYKVETVILNEFNKF